MSRYQENISSSPASIGYGELFVLGYHGIGGHFALRKKPMANGVKRSTKALSIGDQHKISYTVSQMGQVSTVVVEYTRDSNTDMFQIGRSVQGPNDFVVTDEGQSAISRFACRVVCQRSPPYAAHVYAAGFDSAKNIFLSENAVKWRTSDGQMDGLTTNGVLVMHPLHGFTQDYKPDMWREVSVCGNVFTLREACSPQQRGRKVDSESQELVDGSLIDLCGVTLLWRTAEGLARTPMEHLEIQRQEIHDGRPCFVYKSKKDRAGILKHPPRGFSGFPVRVSDPPVPSGSKNRKASDFTAMPRWGHPEYPPSKRFPHTHEIISPGNTKKKVEDFLKRFPVQDLHLPVARVSRPPAPRVSHPAVPSVSRPPVPPKPTNQRPTRKDFLKHACELTLDPNTAHVKMSLSENNRKVTRVEGAQKYPDEADRFKDYGQVMCQENLTGRCYWEVEWSGGVEIAVTYRAINRQGDDSQFGYNDKSWSLRCSGGDNRYTVWHNNEKTDIPVTPSSRSGRVAVYVDPSSGTMSFFKVCSDTLTHLHSFQTRFTEPLYAGFWVGWSDSSVRVFQRQEVQ